MWNVVQTEGTALTNLFDGDSTIQGFECHTKFGLCPAGRGFNQGQKSILVATVEEASLPGGQQGA